MNQPYIGVTGFTTQKEISAVLEIMDRTALTSSRQVMIGILASSKTLSGRKGRWPNRYVMPEEIAELFPSDQRTVNLIHFATSGQTSLTEELEQLVKLGGKNLDGFQLNISWPNPNSLLPLKGLRIVQQISGRTLECVHPEMVARDLDPYIGTITDVLIDGSGGNGIVLDPVRCEKYVQAISERHPDLGIGVAGGLCEITVERLLPLVERHPNLSCDAEGRLRTSGDYLDQTAMADYLCAANAVMDPNRDPNWKRSLGL